MLRSSGDFYQDTRYCARCSSYVPYLLSPEGAFCAHCDEKVVLLRSEDRLALLRSPAYVDSYESREAQLRRTDLQSRR